MDNETTTPEIAGTEAPIESAVVSQAPVQAVETAQPQATVKGPDPDKRPPHEERQFDPSLFDKTVEKIPGAREYIAEKYANPDRLAAVEIKLARAELVTEHGLTKDQAAKMPGKSAEEILGNAKAFMEMLPPVQATPASETQAATPANTSQGNRPAPPSNDVDPGKLTTMSYQDILKEMATS